MARPMTEDERRSFLLHGTRTAVLATLRPDGRPHAAPIGFVLDGDDVLILTNEGSAKGRDVQRDPRVSLVVDDPTPPFAFVMIEGVADSTLERTAERDAAAREIGRRYGGPDAVDEFVQYADTALGLFVRVRPTRIVALDAVGES